jgi:hypothetical protein
MSLGTWGGWVQWRYYTLLYATLRYSTLLYATLRFSTLLYCTLLYATLRYSSLLHATPRYSTLLHATPRYSTLLHATPRYSTLLHATPRLAPFCYARTYQGLCDFWLLRFEVIFTSQVICCNKQEKSCFHNNCHIGGRLWHRPLDSLMCFAQLTAKSGATLWSQTNC